MLRALFVTVMGTTESLITRLVSIILQHDHPDVYQSLGDPSLDAKARSVVYGGPSRWCETLVRLAVPKVADAVDWEALETLWAERNVLVHRSGLVDAKHSAKTGALIGSVIQPTVADMQAASDIVGAARYALTVCVWDRLFPGAGAIAAEGALPPLWEYLRSDRWRLAEGLGRLQEVWAARPESAACAKVNRWLAVRRGTRWPAFSFLATTKEGSACSGGFSGMERSAVMS
jgi:hypothetical protein